MLINFDGRTEAALMVESLDLGFASAADLVLAVVNLWLTARETQRSNDEANEVENMFKHFTPYQCDSYGDRKKQKRNKKRC